MKNNNLVSKNGISVSIPPKTVSHLLAHPMPDGLIQEAIAKIDLVKSFEVIEVEMGRVVGKSGAVRLDSKDTIDTKVSFAIRKGRTNYSRVSDAVPKDCSSVVIVTKKMEDAYNLVTSYIGWEAEKEPTDPYLKDDELKVAQEFWLDYALIHDESMSPTVEMTWEDAILKSADNHHRFKKMQNIQGYESALRSFSGMFDIPYEEPKEREDLIGHV